MNGISERVRRGCTKAMPYEYVRMVSGPNTQTPKNAIIYN